jgi:hypothetical protein
MKLYSKTIIKGGESVSTLPVKGTAFTDLRSCEFNDDDVFYYDKHDLSLRYLEFDKFIDDSHWEHIRNTPTVKVLLDFCDDYLNAVDVQRFSKTLIQRNINPSQVFLIVMDDNFKQFALSQFKKEGIEGINVYHYNLLLKKVLIDYVDTYKTPTEYKFSFLSRNYHTWRLATILKVIDSDMLKHFNYSFHNYLPYQGKDVTLDQVREDVVKEGFELNDTIESWISKLPYDVGTRHSKWNNVTYDTILSSDFHFLIESHLAKGAAVRISLRTFHL